MYVEKEWDLKVNDNQDYTIKIKVGDGQKGHSAFKDLDGNYVHNKEELIHFLGNGQKLKGKYIKISTTATDINSNTNKVSVSYRMNSKLLKTDENPIHREADEDNGSVYFVTKINFK